MAASPQDTAGPGPGWRRIAGDAWSALLRLEAVALGWRGPFFAAMVVLAAALPGALRIPTLDRDEARFAQASAQMLETGDLVNIRFQDAPRDKKPVGIHWLQALSVRIVSSVERREIWAYRLPSLAGAMLAAAACAWGARGVLGSRGGFAAGALLGSSLLLSSEALIAKTDAVLCGAVTLSMAALARLYIAARDGPPAPRWARTVFWAGQALAIMVKGPIGPMVAVLALLALWAADRRADWIRKLGWFWGLILIVAVVGPWAAAITVATDGGFWGKAVSGDLAPKLAGAHETHGAPPGLHLLLSPLLLFPAAALLPAGLAWGWRRRREPFARFALAWLIPSWLVFELAPTKLIHYPLPLYAALAWLCAGALTDTLGPWVRRFGAMLALVAGGALAAVCVLAANRYGDASAGPWALACAALFFAAGAASALGFLRHEVRTGLAAAVVLGVIGHAALAGGLAPALEGLWVSNRAADALARNGLDPRNGLTPGPVAVAGYAEPSLVFALGTETELSDAKAAAEAIDEGRPALVAQAQDKDFRAALAANGTRARSLARVAGFDYSDGHPAVLVLWAPLDAAATGAGR